MPPPAARGPRPLGVIGVTMSEPVTSPLAKDVESGPAAVAPAGAPEGLAAPLLEEGAPPPTDGQLCCHLIVQLGCSLMLPLIIFFGFYNSDCEPRVFTWFMLVFCVGFSTMTIKHFGMHVKVMDMNKEPFEQHPVEMKVIGALTVLIVLANIAFAIWTCVIGIGPGALPTDGCVVCVTYIEVVAYFYLIPACLGVLVACCKFFSGKKDGE